jgi:AraC family transcriptional regulator
VVTHPDGHEHANRTGALGARCINVNFSPSLLEDNAIASLASDAQHLRLAASHPAIARLQHALALQDSSAALSALAASLDVASATLALPTRHGSARWLRTVVDFLEADLSFTPDLCALAALAGVHPSHLVRSFRKAHGESVGAYLRRRRLEVSDARLADTAVPLAQIASDAGFCDQAHFTRAYVRHFGLTPGQRRRLIRS